MKQLRLAACRRRRQRGAYMLVFALLLMPLVLLGGMAIDLSMAYMRRTDLQAAADAAALAAARALDGTEAGIASAGLRAAQVVNTSTYALTNTMTWSPDALRFSDSPDLGGTWLPASAVNAANVATMRYARVDTNGLPSALGEVRAVFASAIDLKFAILRVGAQAVAGRSAVQITPLAICAMDNQAKTVRVNAPGFEEIVEHGFRRGVSYNLLNLNPVGVPALNYQVNPIDFPPAVENAAHRSLATLRPMVCSGTLALPFLPNGASVYVREGFPASLTAELNSRFGSGSGSTCDPVSAPADTNIKEYTVGTFWMRMPAATPSLTQIPASATQVVGAGERKTIADVSGATSGTNRVSYGPLWAFAKPQRYDAATPDTPGASFPKSAWPLLYPVATTEQAEATSIYPTDPMVPYRGTGAFKVSPSPLSYPKLAGRRILNIPLLACPLGAGGTATVLAVGSFLMTSRATDSPLGVHAEFGGLATADSMNSSTVLYR
ncbi:pilus assembly protein TadG-related protein [Massilia sp. CCM 9210]|uniref:pilus assembly protein TadG-related protein n=1 Tax=Massilia scottii TaxID=3057166 RepID=UPI002796D3E5|nr:pilus assembly protein TadG-related protein [Massilia sp. CCM 9210]MDQ1814732.1 pilus assembly protein TadG-related protein [Massilia sp. CCM 9210]